MNTSPCIVCKRRISSSLTFVDGKELPFFVNMCITCVQQILQDSYVFCIHYYVSYMRVKFEDLAVKRLKKQNPDRYSDGSDLRPKLFDSY